jgi:hypothetical protein
MFLNPSSSFMMSMFGDRSKQRDNNAFQPRYNANFSHNYSNNRMNQGQMNSPLNSQNKVAAQMHPAIQQQRQSPVGPSAGMLQTRLGGGDMKPSVFSGIHGI